MNLKFKNSKSSFLYYINMIKEEFDFLKNINFEKNFELNSFKKTLPSNLCLLTFKKLYFESCKFNFNEDLEFLFRNFVIKQDMDSICEKDFLLLLNRLTTLEIRKMSDCMLGE